MGIAPEWRDGHCDRECQEKVSSCLIALSNRTGKHVQVSVLSASPAMLKSSQDLKPGDSDLGFPHQEGAFFGNVFAGEAYACRGSAAEKGAQVKRFCALEPESCTGMAEFTDAGLCEQACDMSCVSLSDGSQRCAANACTDPQGRRWAFHITTYLRNQIEAANASGRTPVVFVHGYWGSDWNWDVMVDRFRDDGWSDDELHVGTDVLDRLHVTEVPVELVVGVLADTTRVEQHEGSVAGSAGPRVALGLEHPGEALGVVLVHLTPVGGDEVSLVRFPHATTLSHPLV